MTYVITRLCRDCVDGACVDVCPTRAIVEHRPSNGTPSDLPQQLFINPDDCIDCNLCLPECPWEAIYRDEDVPLAFVDDLALNAVSAERPKEFDVPVTRLHRRPSSDEVEANKARWGAGSKTDSSDARR
jgi:ferredoxin